MQENESQLDIKRTVLRQEIEETEQKLHTSENEATSIQQDVNKWKELLARLQKKVDNRQRRIQETEKKLADAKVKLGEIVAELKATKLKVDANSQKLDNALIKVEVEQGRLNALKSELEDLDNFVVYLIDPNYDLKDRAPETGRLISIIDFGGLVEVEKAESDIDMLCFSDLLNISGKTGFSNFIEFGNAYQFAWLVIKYQIDQNYETHVITDDDRVLKLIEMLME